ncbi:MAG: hypothetical protein ACK504_04545 [Bacteroidota bacterium]
MKFFFILLPIVLISISIKSQNKCDTNVLLKNLINKQFGADVINFKYLEYKDYSRCQSIDTVNKLLLDLVGIKWKYEYYRHDIENGFWKKTDFKDKAIGIAKKDTIKIKEIIDSLFKVNRNEAINSILLKYQVSYFNIRLCGYLNLKESIPILQKALTLPKRYDIEVVKLTLAKLGDTIVEQNYFNDMLTKKDFNFNDFFGKYSPKNIAYINTQNAYYMYSKKLLVKDVLLDGEPGDYLKRQLRNEILNFLVTKVKNKDLAQLTLDLHKKYKSIIYDVLPNLIDFTITQTMVSDKDMKKIINWFEKNKGKYEF